MHYSTGSKKLLIKIKDIEFKKAINLKCAVLAAHFIKNK